MARKPPAAAVSELYATPVIRKGIWITLSIALLLNVYQVFWALFCTVPRFIPNRFTPETLASYDEWFTPGHKFALFLFYCPIPLTTCTLAIVEIHKRRRQTLSPKWVVVSGSTSLLLWITLDVLWFKCVWWSGKDWARLVSFFGLIPFVWPPLVTILGVSLYIAYTAFGVVAWRRQRTAAAQAKIQGAQGLDEGREWKASTPTLITPETVSDHFPSILQSQFGSSAEPSTAPPSYSAHDSAASTPNSAASSHSRVSSSIL